MKRSGRSVGLRMVIAIPTNHNGRAQNTMWFREYAGPTVQALLQSNPDSLVVPIAMGEACIWSLGKALEYSPDVVFNLHNATGGWEVPFVRALEALELAYTGSTSISLSIARDKSLAKEVLREAGVTVPDSITLHPGHAISGSSMGLAYPLIVKPAVCGGASWGIWSDSVIRSHVSLERRVRRIWSHQQTPALCEEFIVGEEWRVAAFRSQSGDVRLIGALLWQFSSHQAGWGYRTNRMRISSAAKARTGLKAIPVTLSRSIRKKLEPLAEMCLPALGITGPATIDVRVDEIGRMYVLEVNANPGLSPLSPIWGGRFENMLLAMIREANVPDRHPAVSKAAQALRTLVQCEGLSAVSA